MKRSLSILAILISSSSLQTAYAQSATGANATATGV